MSNSTITPNTGALSATVYASAVTLLAGSLALTGYSPNVATASPGVTPTAGTETLVGYAPSLTISSYLPTTYLTPNTGFLSFSIRASQITDLVGSVGIIGYPPSISRSSAAIVPLTGSLSSQGFTPQGQHAVLTPNTGSLSMTTSYTITPSTAQYLSIGTGYILTENTLDIETEDSAGNLLLDGISTSMQFTGYAPIQILTVPSPLNAQMGLVGHAPIVVASQQVFLTPGTGAIGVLGNTSGGSGVNHSVTPNSASPGYVLTEGLLNIELENGTGDILLDGTSMLLTGGISALSYGVAKSPLTNSIAFTGYTVSQKISVAPPAATVSLIGSTPLLLQTLSITPLTGSLAATGQSGLSMNLDIVPNVGSLGAANIAPTWSMNLTTHTGVLSFISGYATLGSAGLVNPQGGSLSMTGYAPTLGAPTYIVPNTGALNGVGTVPIEIGVFQITVNTGALAFTTSVPLVSQIGAIVPNTGSIGFSSAPQSISVAGTIVPNTGSFAFVLPTAPYLTQSKLIVPATGTIQSTSGSVQISPVIVPGTGGIAFASDTQSVIVPQFAYPLTGSLSLTGVTVVPILNGPPVVDEVEITLLQNSLTIGFIIPGSNSMPLPTTTVYESNSITVQLGPFLDVNGNPYLPQALQWLLWDDTNKEQLQAYTALTPASTLTFEVVGSLNSINNPSNLTETRMVLIQTTLPGGEVRYDPAYYNVIAVPDILA